MAAAEEEEGEEEKKKRGLVNQDEWGKSQGVKKRGKKETNKEKKRAKKRNLKVGRNLSSIGLKRELPCSTDRPLLFRTEFSRISHAAAGRAPKLRP